MHWLTPVRPGGRGGGCNRATERCAHLLGAQCEFDEDLLQLFVHKVDAKLLEAVFLWRCRNHD